MKNHGKKIISGVYLCMYDQGTLKIGKGIDVHSRLQAHKSAGNVFGAQVLRIDIVECQNYDLVEKKLIAWCKKNSESTKSKEWFKGVDYEKCLEQAKIFMDAAPTEKEKKRSVDDIFDYMQAHFSGRPIPFTLDCNKKIHGGM